MTVYVDDVRHKFGRMIMCHLWADTEEELQLEATALGLKKIWHQFPPKASWSHYDISLSVKQKAIERGAILTDKFGPPEYVARLRKDERKLAQIAYSRGLRATPPLSTEELESLRKRALELK